MELPVSCLPCYAADAVCKSWRYVIDMYHWDMTWRYVITKPIQIFIDPTPGVDNKIWIYWICKRLRPLIGLVAHMFVLLCLFFVLCLLCFCSAFVVSVFHWILYEISLLCVCSFCFFFCFCWRARACVCVVCVPERSCDSFSQVCIFLLCVLFLLQCFCLLNSRLFYSYFCSTRKIAGPTGSKKLLECRVTLMICSTTWNC